MTNIALEVGKTYKVNHSRKGRFSGRVEAMYRGIATITVTSGTAHAIRPENNATAGHSIIVRISHIRAAQEAKCSRK